MDNWPRWYESSLSISFNILLSLSYTHMTSSLPGTNYLGVFLDLLADLCDASTAQLALDETLVEIEAPVYVLGTVHM